MFFVFRKVPFDELFSVDDKGAFGELRERLIGIAVGIKVIDLTVREHFVKAFDFFVIIAVDAVILSGMGIDL